MRRGRGKNEGALNHGSERRLLSEMGVWADKGSE